MCRNCNQHYQNGIDGNPSTTGLTTTYPGNAGLGFTSTIGITSAVYNERTGNLYLEAPGISVEEGDRFEIRDLLFSCDSGTGIGTTTQLFPSGKYGNEFLSTGLILINHSLSMLEHQLFHIHTFLVDLLLIDQFK